MVPGLGDFAGFVAAPAKARQADRLFVVALVSGLLLLCGALLLGTVLLGAWLLGVA